MVIASMLQLMNQGGRWKRFSFTLYKYQKMGQAHDSIDNEPLCYYAPLALWVCLIGYKLLIRVSSFWQIVSWKTKISTYPKKKTQNCR